MSNPNLNLTMLSDGMLVAYRDSIAAQAVQLEKFRHDTVLELGYRGLQLADLNQEFTGELNLHHMANEQVQDYAASVAVRAEEMWAKLDAVNRELGNRYEQGRAA